MKTLQAKSVVLLHHHLKALRLPTIGSECEKVAAYRGGDHTIFLGRVEAVRARDGDPLLHYRGQYDRLQSALKPGPFSAAGGGVR